jgi:hypothetical protein
MKVIMRKKREIIRIIANSELVKPELVTFQCFFIHLMTVSDYMYSISSQTMVCKPHMCLLNVNAARRQNIILVVLLFCKQMKYEYVVRGALAPKHLCHARCGREWPEPNLSSSSDIALKRLRMTTRNVIQNGRPVRRQWNASSSAESVLRS